MMDGTIGDREAIEEIPTNAPGPPEQFASEMPPESASEVPEDTVGASSEDSARDGAAEANEDVPEDVLVAASAGTQGDDITDLPEDTPHDGAPSAVDLASDSQRAMDLFGDFKQDRWERLSLDDKKRSIEQFADYNTDTLGIDHKPRIDYYADDSSGDYGSFSGADNTLAMNEHNLTDGAEAADTVAHELRHAYQYQHAQNPMSEQDLLFAENFDNYVAPEQDYAGYKDQLLETDARDYARQLREDIRS